MKPGNKSSSAAVLGLFGVLAATSAGLRGEDSIQEVWIAAAHTCRGDTNIVESQATLPEAIAIPAAVEWSPCH